LIAEELDQLCGLIIAWQVVDEIQILEVAVHPQYRRRGIARSLLLALLEQGYALTDINIVLG
jgi:[ribosomal protein S18]-alanine N-acetyltransferase